MLRTLIIAAAFTLPFGAWAQAPESAPLLGSTGTAAVSRPAAEAKPDSLTPTWETQKHARTYLLSIPAPRGQIVDRNGSPLAQTRVSYNLAVAFPTPLRFNDQQAAAFAQQQVASARAILGRPIPFTADKVVTHYKNRGVLPYVIAQDLKPMEIDASRQKNSQSLVLQPTYQRFYPAARSQPRHQLCRAHGRMPTAC